MNILSVFNMNCHEIEDSAKLIIHEFSKNQFMAQFVINF